MTRGIDLATFNSKFEIYFEDISPSGIVHLEKIAEWMSMGREQFFRNTCSDHLWLADRKVAIFTVSMSITIIGRSCWADKISAIISISDIKKISYMVQFKFHNERTNEIIALGAQKVAFINSESGKFSTIPDDIQKVIVNYQR